MKRNSGITLIEILSVVAIMLLLGFLSVPALNIFRGQSALKNSARNIQSMLQEARSMAVAQSVMFYVSFNLTNDSVAIFDQTLAAQKGKRWYAPAAVDIMPFLDKNGNPLPSDTGFKSSGGATQNISIRLKRRNADATDATAYYTVTVINTTGLIRIYPYQKNDPEAP